ncbi:MAG: D-alanyl-D-alanine carboxypeptidase family protein [bacterium]
MKNKKLLTIIFSLALSVSSVALATDPTDISAQLPKSDSTNYNLLAPIGGLRNIKTNDIGGYFNIIIQIIIGLAGVLAVIMIIVNAIKYMGGDSVFNKEEGKHGMTAALLGLFIALGSYALLNTVNPALLGGTLTVDNVSIEINEDPITSDVNTPIPQGSVAQCGGGISRLANTTFSVCNDIKSNLQDLLNAAKTAGKNLTGGGFRTRDQQIALRIKNCNNNTTDPKAPCKPQTAVPGNSNHESGKAFDFSCNGAGTIKSQSSECFVWLAANASKYGLFNYPPEPWHWSWDGK